MTEEVKTNEAAENVNDNAEAVEEKIEASDNGETKTEAVADDPGEFLEDLNKQAQDEQPESEQESDDAKAEEAEPEEKDAPSAETLTAYSGPRAVAGTMVTYVPGSGDREGQQFSNSGECFALVTESFNDRTANLTVFLNGIGNQSCVVHRRSVPAHREGISPVSSYWVS